MRSEKEKLSNYTGLVHAGEGVTINKGVISASGGSGGSGENVLIVNVDINYESADKTFDEIVSALNSGTPVIACVNKNDGLGPQGRLTIPLSCYNGSNTVHGSAIYNIDGTATSVILSWLEISMDSDNYVSVSVGTDVTLPIES